MKKHLLVGLLVIGILALGYSPISNHKIGLDKIENRSQETIKKSGKVLLNKVITKTDENNNYLENVTFKAYSYNRAWESDNSIPVPDYEEHKLFSTNESNDMYDVLYRTLSDEQKGAINNISNTDDLKPFINKNVLSCSTVNRKSTEINYFCMMLLPTVFTIEETQAPEGYVKEKILIPAAIAVGFDVKDYVPTEMKNSSVNYEIPYFDKSYLVELIGFYLADIEHTFSMDYGEVPIENLVGLDINETWEIWKSHHRSEDLEPCFSIDESPFAIQKKSNANINELRLPVLNAEENRNCSRIVIKNHKGTVNLSATYYVNNSESTTVAINSKIDYKIVVNNTGTSDAVDSVVNAKLPEGFIYVEGSASDGGKLVNGSIQWRVGRIKTSQNKELTFQAYAPRGTNLIQEYVGETTIENFAMDNNVQSNKTIVKLSEEYVPIPNTAKNVSIIVILLGAIITSIGVVLITANLKKRQAM